MAGVVSRWLERFSLEQQENAELRGRTAAAGCSAIQDAPTRERVDVHGVLQDVTLRPVDDATALEATLYDGTGTVTLIWLGRRRIEGIAAGRSLTAGGRIGHRGQERVMYNPAYRLDP
ncbi:DNA-binding protein [Aeromicrobium sp. 636]|uniref:OB-fold nucleic acid binding domain-containing protein n=1 Tax=Aeromicrobium senzhongii TaxID=2663859 RepID=A0A8I0ET21_9ACTN|nr:MULTISPECIES: OB-fold nucleic acid binding domain-containing protein [Aeromicrobium]MBC9224891.1 OB-fold nucleic acid binding domain-containing protein [Aeromicrobium senzhongii]MCQ3997003.1 DNA-binding protein [Aeromicrobium sp. 636]MTB86937.1 DNA-binding protein [Aeromicrobium senzhongii]QNL93233.1 OB-fold nucleic acid binding domain-containing protein [Aeromicrobium senzhongii]